MTRIFLEDEIDRAEERKLRSLVRELKKVRKDYALYRKRCPAPTSGRGLTEEILGSSA